jgi:phospholipid/cholesterol/gamma-HCH transport system substrate-binding protein
MKNRQYNFPPLGLNPLVGTQARPNEVTFSEEWMRPDYVPPAAPGQGTPVPAQAPGAPAPLAAEAPNAPPPETTSTDPAAGLPGMMVPPGGG